MAHFPFREVHHHSTYIPDSIFNLIQGKLPIRDPLNISWFVFLPY